MKKTILAVAAVAVSLAGFSQDLMSKKGEAILPEAGDYAIGFDAVPLFNALKFNSADAKIGADYTNYGILVKRFTDAKNAWRFGANLGLSSSVVKQDVDKLDAGVVDGDNTVENRTSTTEFNVTLSAGKEMRRGNTRVQGYYGYEGLVSMGSKRVNTEFGNDFDDMNDGDYTTSDRSGVRFGVGARAFFGVEYFFAPKMSLNLEYGLGAMFSTTGRGEQHITHVAAGDSNSEVVEGGSRTNTFNLSTDRANVAGLQQGSVRLLFHF